MEKKLFILVALFVICSTSATAFALEPQWFGGAHDRQWTNPDNWNSNLIPPGPVPGAADKAKINYVWANPGPIISTPGVRVGEIFISEDADPGCQGEQTLTIATGGELTTGSDGGVPYAGQVNIGYFAPSVVPNHSGRLIMDGGTMNVSGHFWLGWAGIGHLNVNSGTLNVGTHAAPTMFGIGWGGAEGFGTINLDGGLLHTTQWWGGTGWLTTHNYTFDITHGTWEEHGYFVDEVQYLKDNGWITGYGDPEKVVITWDPVRELTVVTAIPEPITLSLLGLGALLLRRRS